VLAFFVAATVVALMQLLRTRDRRVLPLVLMFAFLAQAHSRDWQDPWRGRFDFLAGSCGLVLLLMLAPGHKPSH